jgi:hypothetical protein
MACHLAWGVWGRIGVCAGIVALGACGGGGGDALTGRGGAVGTGLGGHVGGSTGTGAGAGTGGVGASNGAFGNNVDVLMMIDDSSSMIEMQGKLYDQLPLFVNALQSLSIQPNLHLAVVSSDMGAPGDSTSSIGCTQSGDQGQFQSAPQSNALLNPPATCTATTLTNPTGASDTTHTFISDAAGMVNFTDPLASVLQCIALLGDKGCGFEHQLASIDRALGADGLGAAPSTNAGFLRSNAYLVIVMLTNEDDCSAPAGSTIYSLNGAQQNISNPDGPIANYRCNGGPRGAHYCQRPSKGNTWLVPPLTPPVDYQGTAAAPTLDLANCVDNEQPPNGTGTSALTPVSKFVSDIKSLKPDPDNQIVVAAIAGPAGPYTVAWVPQNGGQSTNPGELWPQVMHSCGMAGADDVNPAATQNPTDGSFADPGVRITQFVNAFPNNALGSICDVSYAPTLSAVATKIGQLIGNP